MPSKPAPLNKMTMLIPFVKYYLSKGFDIKDITILEGISFETLLDPNQLLTSKTMNIAVVQMSELMGEKTLGFNIGWEMAQKKNGPFAQFLSEDCSLNDCLSTVIRHFDSESTAGSHQYIVSSDFVTISGKRTYDSEVNDRRQGDATFVGFFLGLIESKITNKWQGDSFLIQLTDPSLIPNELIPKQSMVKSVKNHISIQFPSAWLEVYSSNCTITTINQDYSETITTQLFATNKAKRVTMKEVATMAGMSVREFKGRLKSDGLTFPQFLLKIKIEKACELLNDNRWSIEEIALQLGYVSTANFCRAFKNRCGETPLKYRNSINVRGAES
ncbi:HTH araC/xylS-type domain-containing protein [Vibrio chagasii]|uniref:helix-turn-helix domain-containing protein n=1 Tax=Vibrio coralliirubri TaxID=1516159 RepID=UPI00063698F1|nr:AraC family transcriptional regulator [Vibrio coralliirubri]CAH7293276.1 HTH araC/xylS-type domain-containing protein [Vibrio chagasii]CDT48727.1 hypothetical protein VCR29J2_350066 [Vibrio coralliirubri]